MNERIERLKTKVDGLKAKLEEAKLAGVESEIATAKKALNWAEYEYSHAVTLSHHIAGQY